MGMYVDTARQKYLARSVHKGGAICGQAAPHSGDAAVVQQQVALLYTLRGNHCSVADKGLARRFFHMNPLG